MTIVDIVDISKIKPGDKGTIEVTFGKRLGVGVEILPNGKLTYDGEAIDCDRPGAPVFVHQSRIVSHTPAPREIKVGDQVIPKDCNELWTVIAIDGDVAWVRWGKLRSSVNLGDVKATP